jgi:hypothetical protein
MLYNPPVGATDPNASYIQGDASLGIQGSKPPAIGFESVQREIVNVIAAAGFTPSNSDLTQLMKSIQRGLTNIGGDTGTANAALAVFSPAVTGMIAGMRFWVLKTTNTNTGAMTFNGLALKWADGTQLAAGDWPASTFAHLVYNGSSFNLLSVAGPTVFERKSTWSIASNGYQKFGSSGLILQWGANNFPTSAGPTATKAVTFPIAFPASVFAVIGSAGGGSNSTNGSLPAFGAQSLSTSGFTAVADNLSGGELNMWPINQVVPFTWVALGN